MVDKPYRYGPQDLWKYINGEAESFLAYGFVSLNGANYASKSDRNDSVGVDIYDMEKKLNAFGLFQSMRGGESSSLKIGAASFGSGGFIVFYQDRYYVEVLSFVKSEQWKRHHLLIAQKVAEKIGGDVSPPDELSYLPQHGAIEGSERYVTGGILGHAFLDRGLICDYRIDGDAVSAFVAFFSSGGEAAGSFESHKDFLRRSGKECLPLKGFEERGFVSQEPYHGNILVVKEGNFVLGVYDLLKTEKGMALLTDILRRIRPSH
ncbi:MAG: DUF6599 family protein [Thermodesulfobacteriota bacterium]|nr:DUF6599 family protein [Thermodesulfobacteriota bacterium]